LGLVLAVAISAANVHDSVGARSVLPQLGWDAYPRLTTVFADEAYRGPLMDWTAETLGISLEIVPKLEGQSTFVVRPKRWIVERTFAWLMRYRRLRSDYETTTASGVGWIYTSMIHLMVRRLSD
jgi:transposase